MGSKINYLQDLPIELSETETGIAVKKGQTLIVGEKIMAFDCALDAKEFSQILRGK